MSGEGPLDRMEAEREDWRGKAEHRLNEWRLRDPCSRCEGDGFDVADNPGWRRILSEPEQVIAEQTQLAEGVFV